MFVHFDHGNLKIGQIINFPGLMGRNKSSNKIQILSIQRQALETYVVERDALITTEIYKMIKSIHVFILFNYTVNTNIFYRYLWSDHYLLETALDKRGDRYKLNLCLHDAVFQDEKGINQIYT